MAARSSRISTFYFLDWRPVAFSAPHPEQIERVSIDIDLLRSHLLHPEAALRFRHVHRLRSVDLVVRNDGAMVMRIQLTADFDPDGVDELAHLVGLHAKAVLGHGHHFHRLHEPVESGRNNRIRAAIILLLSGVLLGLPVWVLSAWLAYPSLKGLRRGVRRLGPKRLRASRVLRIYPIMLTPKTAKAIFASTSNSLSSEELKALQMTPGQASQMKSGAGEALLELKFAYVRLFDDVANRLVEHSRDQHRPRPILRASAILVYLTLSIIVVSMIVREPSMGAAVTASTPTEALLGSSPRFIFGAGLFTLGVSTTMYFFFKMRTWELPKVKLLRAAQGFFAHSNPVNRVVETAFGHDVAGGDFKDAITTLQAKIDGEAHRLTVSQFWLTLSVATSGLLLAALALKL